jgi:hypothetical protein
MKEQDNEGDIGVETSKPETRPTFALTLRSRQPTAPTPASDASATTPTCASHSSGTAASTMTARSALYTKLFEAMPGALDVRL